MTFARTSSPDATIAMLRLAIELLTPVIMMGDHAEHGAPSPSREILPLPGSVPGGWPADVLGIMAIRWVQRAWGPGRAPLNGPCCHYFGVWLYPLLFMQSV